VAHDRGIEYPPEHFTFTVATIFFRIDPIEQVWRKIKVDSLTNKTFENYDYIV
jgi:hypothetical protein